MLSFGIDYKSNTNIKIEQNYIGMMSKLYIVSSIFIYFIWFDFIYKD